MYLVFQKLSAGTYPILQKMMLREGYPSLTLAAWAYLLGSVLIGMCVLTSSVEASDWCVRCSAGTRVGGGGVFWGADASTLTRWGRCPTDAIPACLHDVTPCVCFPPTVPAPRAPTPLTDAPPPFAPALNSAPHPKSAPHPPQVLFARRRRLHLVFGAPQLRVQLLRDGVRERQDDAGRRHECVTAVTRVWLHQPRGAVPRRRVSARAHHRRLPLP